MNIAKDAVAARLAKGHALRSARTVETEIEGVRRRIGKNVVKDVVVVGKVDGRIYRDDNNMRNEGLVLLCHFGMDGALCHRRVNPVGIHDGRCAGMASSDNLNVPGKIRSLRSDADQDQTAEK